MSFEPEDFELGEDVTHEFDRVKGRAGAVISVRLDGSEARRLFAVAEVEGKPVTQVAKEAIDAYVRAASMASGNDESVDSRKSA